jgi:hypothetical protein
MKTRRINFAEEFTDCPGGRLEIYGSHSGEEFREKFLRPALLENEKVILNLNNVLGFPASFLDEAFGILAAEIGLSVLKKKLAIELDDNPIALAEINDCMETHAA